MTRSEPSLPYAWREGLLHSQDQGKRGRGRPEERHDATSGSAVLA